MISNIIMINTDFPLPAIIESDTLSPPTYVEASRDDFETEQQNIDNIIELLINTFNLIGIDNADEIIQNIKENPENFINDDKPIIKRLSMAIIDYKKELNEVQKELNESQKELNELQKKLNEAKKELEYSKSLPISHQKEKKITPLKEKKVVESKAKKVVESKAKKVVKSKEKTPKTDKKTYVKLDKDEVSVEFCSARVWGSAKDGTAGLPTNQCKKKASNGCFCTMHFNKNVEQSPYCMGLITDDPPETDHKGKAIHWVRCVPIKKKTKPGKSDSDTDTEIESTDSDTDTEIESESEPDCMGEESDDGEVFESIVIDGHDYQIDLNNNVYEEDEDGDWVKVGIWTERGELVKDD